MIVMPVFSRVCLNELDTHCSILDAADVQRITQGVRARPEEDAKYVDVHARATLWESAQEENGRQLQSWVDMRSLPATKLHEKSRSFMKRKKECEECCIQLKNVYVKNETQSKEVVASHEQTIAKLQKALDTAQQNEHAARQTAQQEYDATQALHQHPRMSSSRAYKHNSTPSSRPSTRKQPVSGQRTTSLIPLKKEHELVLTKRLRSAIRQAWFSVPGLYVRSGAVL